MDIWNKSHTKEVAQIYGTLIFLGLTAYFLLMYAVGAIHIIGLRFLNVLIMFAGLYYAIRQYRRTHDGTISYFRALTLGTATGFIGSATFGIFLFFFLRFEGNLMESIQQNASVGHYLNPYIAAAVVMVEGLISAFGISYGLLNFLSTEKATKPQGGEIPVTEKKGTYE